MNVWEYINPVGDEERTAPREPFAPEIRNYLTTPDSLSTIHERYWRRHDADQPDNRFNREAVHTRHGYERRCATSAHSAEKAFCT